MSRDSISRVALVVFLGLMAPGVGRPAMAADSVNEDAVHLWISRVQETLGGEKAIAGLTSLAVGASCRGPGGSFETEVLSFRSDWVRFHQTHDDGETLIWSGPDRTWSIESNGEITDHDPGTRSFLRGHEFHFLLLELQTRFTNHRLGAEATVRERSCSTLLMEDEMGQAASIYIDNKTHLPMMLEMNPDGAAGPVRTYFDGWESKAGILFFHGFDLTEGSDRRFRYDYHSIEPNVVSGLEFVAPVSPDRHDDRLGILTILKNDRRAHLETSVELLIGSIGENLIEVSAGAINSVTRADVAEMFKGVFEEAVYEQWEDTEPPRLKLSADGSLAWVTRRVAVRRTSPGPNREERSSFISAYSSTYEKQGDTWKMTSVTSTFLPGSSD